MQDVNALYAADGPTPCCYFCDGPHSRDACPTVRWDDWAHLAEDMLADARRICQATPEQDIRERLVMMRAAEQCIADARRMLEADLEERRRWA